MRKEIKKLIKGINAFEESSHRTLSTGKCDYNEISKVFIDKFPFELDSLIIELNSSDKEMLNILHNNISISVIKNDFIELGLEINIHPLEINTSSKFDIKVKNILIKLTSLKNNLRIILKQLPKENKSLFEEGNIDKKLVLEYLEKSMISFQKTTHIPVIEKEKIVTQYKEIIKEVEKPKTCWDKVLGCFNVLAIALTCYSAGPDVMDDAAKAYNHIRSEMTIEKRTIELPDKKYEIGNEIPILIANK